MRASNIIIIGLAAVFGLLSIFAGRSWLTRQAEAKARQLEAAAQRAPTATNKIVVAGQPLRFGIKLESGMLREIDWPSGQLPQGAYGSIPDVFAQSGERIVLASMDPNEPVLATKVTAPGERATLSRMLREGMKAVTIQANAVAGVGGFVNPGDHVDVILTRSGGEGASTGASADIVLQNVRVLAVDQSADDRKFKATVAQTVTLEVPMREAQRILLAASVGTLSLVLRSAGDADAPEASRVSLADLGVGDRPAPPVQPAPATRSAQPAPGPGWSLSNVFGGGAAAPAKPEPKTVTVGVSRGVNRQEYRVPSPEQPGPAPRLAAAKE